MADLLIAFPGDFLLKQKSDVLFALFPGIDYHKAATTLMSYVSYLLDLPPELRRPLVQALETLEQNLRAELVARRQDILDMQATLFEMERRADERLTRLEAVVAELAEAQRRSEERLTRLEAIVAELAEAQRRTEQRVEELAEAQRRTEQRVEELAEAQRRSEERFARLEAIVAELVEVVRVLAQRVDRIDITVARLLGDNVERRYRERAATYLARVLQKVRVVTLDTLMDELEKVLDDEEIDDLLSLDLLLNGKVRQLAERPEVWIACEASSTIERNDVLRARRRANLLVKAGYPTLAAVAGEQIDDRVLSMAQKESVLVLRDGSYRFWQEALQRALGA